MKTKNSITDVFMPVLVGILVVIFFWYMYIGRYGDSWKERTTPLSQNTIAVLCKNFDLKKDHKLCSGKKEVYGPDFYDIIRDTFRPYEEYRMKEEAVTYDEVEERIGAFKDDCFPVVHQADGFTYYSCDYDLRGDNEFVIGIIFTYPDNVVYANYTPMGYDGE